MAGRDAVSALRAGGLVMLIDGHARTGGVELWMAAEVAEAPVFARLVRHTSGFVTVALPAARCSALVLPAMAGGEAWLKESRPIQAVTCDAAEGVTTGISAADRALTARLLADPDSAPEDFKRPGHLVPLRVREGLTDRTAPASAALAMCSISGLHKAMIRCEVVLPSGELARPSDGFELAGSLGSPVVLLGDVQAVAPVAPVALTA
jgi:3,4-dihydroxy-2-butanone 4-phosphate synthase